MRALTIEEPGLPTDDGETLTEAHRCEAPLKDLRAVPMPRLQPEGVIKKNRK